MHHNRWLDWKIRHGLASRGRVGGKLNPKGILGGLLYKYYFSKHPEKPGTVFKQSVGGSLGASGDVK